MNNLEVLVFSSEDCQPCKSYIPVVKEVCNEMTLSLRVVKRESNKELFEEYDVMSVPVTMLLVEGKAMWSEYGVKPHIRLYEKLKELKYRYDY